MSEEEAFNEEFARIVDEKEPCPICHRGPVELGYLRVEETDEVMLYAVCGVGHTYVVTPDEEDDDED